MSESGSDPRYKAYDAEHVVSRADESTLPRPLDPVITMAAVQQYVENERNRSRRVFVWGASVFLLIILLVLVLFVLVGVFVLKSSRRTAGVVDDIRSQTAVYAGEVSGMTNRIERIAVTSEEVKRTVLDSEAERARDEKLLKLDLKRFSRWVAQSNSRDTDAIARLEAELKAVRELAEQRQAELDALAAGRGVREPTREPRRPVAEPDTGDMVAEPVEMAVAPVDSTTPPEESPPVTIPEPADAPREISVVTFPNGDRYEGEFANGLFHGWGVFYHQNGDRYDGEFQNDMKNGKGTLTYASGEKYMGGFKDNLRNGRGSLTMANGDRYVGEFKNDMKDGKGTLVLSDGSKYVGDFKNGVKSGNGVFTFANGDEYKGEFGNDLRNGKGSYSFGNGAKYIGEFRDGWRHGTGRYIYPGGEEYVGEFREGRKHGEGVCIYANGSRVRGVWNDDRFVRRIEE